MGTIVFRGPRALAVAHVRAVVAAAAGRAPDPAGLVDPLLTRAANALLGCVRAAFLAKSAGHAGDDGVTWKPLDRRTVAARPATPGERKALGVGGKRVRGLLTPAQDRRWRQISARTLARLRARGAEGAEGIAARVAWAALKAAGAKTRPEVLGGRAVPIGRDTDALYQSLAPGDGGRRSGATGQVFEVRPGRLAVGSAVPHARHFHAARPLWPADLPPPWAEAVAGALATGLVDAVARALGGGG